MEAAGESAARNPLGAVGNCVIENIRQLRERRKLTYTELAGRLEELGRPIPVLGLSRIEKGRRRVDADDLVALAVALGVNPSGLLLPRATSADDEIELTPAVRHRAWIAWQWADGQEPLPETSAGSGSETTVRRTLAEVVDFREHARPQWARDVPQFDVLARMDDLEQRVREIRGEKAGRRQVAGGGKTP